MQSRIRNGSISISTIINAAWFWLRNSGIRSESLRFALNSIVPARCSDFFFEKAVRIYPYSSGLQDRFWNLAAPIRSDSLIFEPSWIMFFMFRTLFPSIKALLSWNGTCNSAVAAFKMSLLWSSDDIDYPIDFRCSSIVQFYQIKKIKEIRFFHKLRDSIGVFKLNLHFLHPRCPYSYSLSISIFQTIFDVLPWFKCIKSER